MKSPRREYISKPTSEVAMKDIEQERVFQSVEQGLQKLMQKGVHPWKQNQNVIIELLPLQRQRIITITTWKDSIIHKVPNCCESHIFHWIWILMQNVYGEAFGNLGNHCHREQWKDLQQLTFYSLPGIVHRQNPHSFSLRYVLLWCYSTDGDTKLESSNLVNVT